MKREERHRQIASMVEQMGGEVSVRDLAQELGLSTSHVGSLARETLNKGLIQGEKSVPVLGYIFHEPGAGRTNGGDEYNGELQVLISRDALLSAVKKHAPHRYEEAAGMTLAELRRFVRNEVAERTVTVNQAWRFYPAKS